ncbi:MAG: hypothetical protein O3C20_24475, partial [Verrucomicrobia bacterium]|nr:hypothetical protein [Verrucomicrobiota bacterium]
LTSTNQMNLNNNLSTTGLHFSGQSQIAFKTEATEEYSIARAQNPEKKIQTYQFMKGRYFPGDLKRTSMEKVTFMEILENLAIHLQKQNFYPDPENGEGDLVIVVHYGVTNAELDFNNMFGYESLSDYGYDLVGTGPSQLANMDALASVGFNLASKELVERSNVASGYLKASLLGMEEAYDVVPPENEYDLKEMLSEPRFFIILMAYDLPLAKKGTLKVHWTTRFSVRAIGQPFDVAIQNMNEVAGNYFGKNLKGLNKRFLDDDSQVEIGEIEVIEEEKK